MPFTPNYRKRRPQSNLNKNELKTSRNEAKERSRSAAGTLRERFPDVRKLNLSIRMESPTGVVLQESTKTIGLDEALIQDIVCEGGCTGGLFKLTEIIEGVLQAKQENREGMGICQGSSFRDPSLPCGIRFTYQLLVTY